MGRPVCVPLGSSPLARGARVPMRSSAAGLRLIPAGAGSTTVLVVEAIDRQAHPRWRGEHTGIQPITEIQTGSSPLARGAHYRRSRRGCFEGLIPAGAGSTHLYSRLSRAHRAHPRWRGEHHTPTIEANKVSGSSPLARGAHSLSCGSLSRWANSTSACFHHRLPD